MKLPPQTLPPPDPRLAQVFPGQPPTGGSIVAAAYTTQLHIGPLPSSAEFKAYKEAHEGAAEWILAEATKSADHVRAVEMAGMRVAARDAHLFRLLPFGVVALFLTVFTIVSFANVWVGAIGLGATLTSVVLAYLKGFGIETGNDAAPQASPEMPPAQLVPTRPPPTPRERGQ